MKINLLAWAYNEQETIPLFMSEYQKLSEELNLSLIVVNDGSTDNTKTILDSYQSKYGITVIHLERNQGVANAMKVAISAAESDFVFWQTLDWSYQLSSFVNAIKNKEIRENYDVIVGSRCPRGQNIALSVLHRSDNFWKGIVSLCNWIVVKLFFRLPFRDVQNIYLIETRVLKNMKLISNSSFISPEVLHRLWTHGNRFLEVPVPFKPRENGMGQTIRLRTILETILDLLAYKLNQKMEREKNRGLSTLDSFSEVRKHY